MFGMDENILTTSIVHCNLEIGFHKVLLLFVTFCNQVYLLIASKIVVFTAKTSSQATHTKRFNLNKPIHLPKEPKLLYELETAFMHLNNCAKP